MALKVIATSSAPAAIGTYSQAVATQRAITVYLSGQIPLDAETMDLVSDDFTAQAHQVFVNLTEVAKAAGGSLADCVKLNVYLTDLANFPALNSVMAEYITEPFPARAAVEVSALPRGAKIEIDAVMSLE
ncbi:MAG: reactive intermediate/imine deaminase [Candidatus Azotimanducaceae bacterium]|jgi:reactive intermediate/imine deaminase